MSTGLTASMAWLIGFCVIAEAAREVCFKQAANHTALFKAMALQIIGSALILAGVWFISIAPEEIGSRIKAEESLS